MDGKKAEVEHFTEAPEIQHFAMEKVSKNDNAYGVTWGNLVKEYLRSAYVADSKKAEVISFGKTYKVLKRDEVTVFYDADGNTLFDVENRRLEKDYKYLVDMHEILVQEDVEVKYGSAEELTDAAESGKLEKDKGKTEKPMPMCSVVDGAVAKLHAELDKAKDKEFAKPVIEYLLERCRESESLAADICQDHKAWEKCYKYIYKEARKKLNSKSGPVRDDVVFEWAEDYFHLDDKALEEKKAKEETERKKAAEKKKQDTEKKGKATSVKSPESKKTEEKKPEESKRQREVQEQKPKKNELDGQMDMFSLMGM